MDRIAPTLQRTLEKVVQQMPAAVVVADPDGRILLSNAEAGKILRDRGWPLEAALRGTESVARQDLAIERGDGTAGTIRFSAAPIQGDGGEILARVITFFDVTEERREQDALTFLADASAAIGASLLYDETLREIVRLAIPKFADLAIVYLMDEGEIKRHEVAAADNALRERILGMWRKFPPNRGAIAQVVDRGESMIIPSITDEAFNYLEDREQRAAAIGLGIRSVLSVPIQSGGFIFGALTFALTAEERVYDQFDLFIAEEIARRAAAAIERSRLFEAEREQRVRAEQAMQRVQHLQDVTAAVSSAITIEEVCDAVIQAAGSIGGSSVAVIALVREDHLEVIRTAGVSQEVAEQFRIIPLDAQLPLTVAVRTRKPVFLGTKEQAFAHSPFLRSVQPRTGSNAWAVVPLEVQGRILGVLGLSFREEQRFDDSDRDFLLSVGRQCALALERAHLFGSERRAREEAERASRAKDDFLAVLSHELRTPMTTVIGWADYIRMTHGNVQSLLGPLEALRASARTQAKLVDDLLDVSRIITGKLSIDRREVDLTAIVRTVVEPLRVTAEAKGVELEVRVPGKPVMLLGDPDRLQQIVTNLVTNAIKFTPGGGRVFVCVSDHGETKELIVEDNGEGISPDFLPHVFDRFRQASVGDSRRHSGLGLGLSIVQHLVQLHGGTVAAESEGLGRGAVFTVRLPAHG